MKDTSTKLIRSVKTAAANYGIARLSTRIIAETAGVNDALIYRYFGSKDELLRRAYEEESNDIFICVINNLDEVYNIPFSFRNKARLQFHKVWREMLSDHNRLRFVTGYYHSGYVKLVPECHLNQYYQLSKKLGHLFPDESSCKWALFSLMALIYEAAGYVVNGVCEDTPETEERAFAVGYAMLMSQTKEGG